MAHVFYSGKMASDQLDSKLTNAIAQDGSGNNVAVYDGALLKLGNPATDSTYGESLPEFDTYIATAPAAATDEVVIVDYAGISEGVVAGNTYKIGNKLIDLQVPAGRVTRARRFDLHDKFWLGADNFSAAPTVGQFAIPAAGVTTFAPAAAAQASGLSVKIISSSDLTVGMSALGLKYLCEVVSL